MEEKLTKIISEAQAVFMRFGIKSVNMDDIARHLGISKKTLYKYVSDKADLVQKCFFMHCEMEEKQLSRISSMDMNAIDESFETMHFIKDMIKDVHPSIMFDMEKYYPEVMKKTEDIRQKTVYANLKANLEKGIKEGLYREDLNPEIIAHIYVSSVEAIFHSQQFMKSQVSLSDLYLELFRYHIRGIASTKGREYLIEKIKTERTSNA
ncbi:MAG: TetR/AcrR family transcriptional regulator [Flavobacteriales bacterium]|nr:TetR/AcrR family transcriptional regulator [Flavobacteriales bacterium]MDG2245501.1 TetR/AcrR family transcriptional regulator [Flavobacteriales bacterium]